MKNKIYFLAAIYAIAFVLNFVWENIHARFYAGYGGFWHFFPLTGVATFWDGAIILGIYIAIALLRRDIYWARSLNRQSLAGAVVLGIGVAVYIEMRALREGRWGYNELMPLIYGLGLTPILQMIVLPAVSYYLVAKIEKLENNKNH